jgi:hypothetical protein
LPVVCLFQQYLIVFFFLPDVQVLRQERCIEVTEYKGLEVEKILEAANSVAAQPQATGARVKKTTKVQPNEDERRHTAFAKKILVEKKGTPLECLVRV